MKVSQLDFQYPQNLVALAPQRPSRIMWVQDGHPQELAWPEFLELFKPGDVLILNETKVVPFRIFATNERGSSFEVLFLEPAGLPSLSASLVEPMDSWKVLFPSSRLKQSETLLLPENITAEVVERGRIQTLRLSKPIDQDYFYKNGEMPLPPYIQKVRGERHNQNSDSLWYQTAWAAVAGSTAAPTASLHFSTVDLQFLQKRGVLVEKLVLHVGLGTFLPVTSEDLNEHVMHEEWVRIPKDTWRAVETAKKEKQRVWAMGSTVVRALESAALGQIPYSMHEETFLGRTRLLIQPGFRFRVVDAVLTNFHQPRSTLLAMVAAFAGLESTLACYRWAIEKKFRLFSYGDLTVWTDPR